VWIEMANNNEHQEKQFQSMETMKLGISIDDQNEQLLEQDFSIERIE
jgi:hypothetical protein